MTSSLSVVASATVIQAIILSHLDQCSGLLYGVADGQLRRLQLVQSAAARLITGPYYTSLATSSAMHLVQASCLDV